MTRSDLVSTRSRQSTRNAIEVLDDTKLMTQFEGLGDNCEFGVVQRCCGAEPLGLFRFSSSSIEHMIDVIASRCERLYTGDDIDIFIEKSLNEYCLISRHYGDFPFHSQIDAGSISQDAMMAKASTQMLYLKERFAADLEAGQKIFVRKGYESLDTIRRLHEALRAHGVNRLLWVVPASGDNQPGTVDVLQPGLLRGYVARFKNFENDQPVDLINWVMVCRKAYALSQASGDCRLVFGSDRPSVRGQDWAFGPLCKAEYRIAVPAANHQSPATRLTATRDTLGYEPVATQTMALAAQPRDMVVFSAWVWVDDRFVGNRIDITLHPWSDLVLQMADLTKRNCWQMIWASARVPRGGGGPIVATLRAGVTAGSVFYVSAWTLEHGTIPTSTTRPAGVPRPVDRFLLFVHRLASRLAGILEPQDATARLREVAKGGRAWRSFVITSQALMKERRFDDADRVLLQALAAWPGDRDLLKLYAWSAHVSARYDRAIERWRDALAAAPGDPLCHGALAANLREHGDLEAAEATIQAALPNFANEIVIVTEAGRIAQIRARHEEALAHWDKALALAPPHPDWVRSRAEAMHALDAKRSVAPSPT